MEVDQSAFVALANEPLRFRIKQDDLQGAYDIARLAGEYVNIIVVVTATELIFRTDAEGLSCGSRCKIEDVRGPAIEFAVNMGRSILAELAGKKAKWGALDCKVAAQPKAAGKAGAWITLWQFEYLETFAMCSAEPIDSPKPLLDLSDAKEVDAHAFAQTLRWLKPFTDAESKKTQFTAACVEAGGGYAFQQLAGRRVAGQSDSERQTHISSSHINDLAHALARLHKPVCMSVDENHALFRDAKSVCKVRVSSRPALFPSVPVDSVDATICIKAGEWTDAVSRLASQAKRNGGAIRIQAGPSIGSFALLSTDVDGGTARFRLPLRNPPAQAIDSIVAVALLGKMLAPSGGDEADLTFHNKAVTCRQSPGDASIMTLVTATRAP